MFQINFLIFQSETNYKILYITVLLILIYKYFLEMFVIKIIVYYPLKFVIKK